MNNTKEIERGIVQMEKQMPVNIINQNTYDEAVAYGKQVSKMEKYIDGEEKKITKPLNESLKAARDLFRPYKEKCAEVKNEIKRKMSAYVCAEAEKKQKEEERDLARLERGTMREETVTKKMVTREETATETTGTTFKHLIIKSVDISKVPTEYLMLDEAKAKADYREGKEIKGITFEYETRARL